MEATKARASWQCTANHSFFQEEGRRNMKVCPSSTTYKLESDEAPGNAANVSDHSNPAHMHLKCSSDLPPDMEWRLHLHPKFENQKDNICEQPNALGAEVNISTAASVNKSAKLSQDHQIMKYYDHNFAGQPRKVSATSAKTDQDIGMQELKALLSDDVQKTPKKDIGEFWYPDDHLHLEFNGVSELPKTLSSDFDSHWLGAEKAEPWWRTAREDELASFVAEKSRENIENCDLPRPRIKHFIKGLSAFHKNIGHGEMLASSLDWMGEMGLSSLANYDGGRHNHVCGDEKQSTVREMRLSLNYSGRLLSGNDDNDTANKNQAEPHTSGNGPSKAQLLEALCHSQTRAREAEKAAQAAYTEKEHIITLFFRQASQLFAYKQWLLLLQLENFCIRLKDKSQPFSTLFPATLPWVPEKGRQIKKGWQKAGKRKHSSPRLVVIVMIVL
ncbi:hypothetical protein CFOL_v3_09689 [Cephalotus follicularis]|uniref:Uncharacterized protein n=1 Tax=Cephalotus follicularis TaxID=3775 RepID=A0A1Q3BE59_CEPFO|nr:hypothetical protein CFOL_v3_09689 [Cephalotus follicularis]